MRIPLDSSHERNTDAIDNENAIEIARLMHQDYLALSGMGELLPRQIDLSSMHHVLDLACGPGGWLLEVARTYPSAHMVGIDTSKHMVEYAQAHAWVQRIRNVEFRQMNIWEPLDILDNVFDVINARFIVSIMPQGAWPGLIRECLRITRPGGVLRLTEAELGFSNSAACEQLNSRFAAALHRSRQGFSPSGQHLGITPMLGFFLRQGGYQNVQRTAHVVDYSTGTQAHDAFYQNFILAYKQLKPFLIQAGVCQSEEFEQLYQQVQADMSAKEFCGVWFYLSTWGTKGSKETPSSLLRLQLGMNSSQGTLDPSRWKFPRLADFHALSNTLRWLRDRKYEGYPLLLLMLTCL